MAIVWDEPKAIGKNIIWDEEEQKPSFRSEVVAPFTHAASALAFDVPRTAMEMQVNRGTPGAEEARRFLYPEQQTFPGKMLRVGLEGLATVGGGAGRLAGGVFGKLAPLAKKGLAGKVARAAASGATFGAATTAPTKEEYGTGVATNAAFGAAFPVAGAGLKFAGKGTKEFGKFISKNVGGITDSTREIINRLGPERVFEPIKAQADYIGKVIVPKLRDKIIGVVGKADIGSRAVLRNLGFDDKEILRLAQVNPQYKARLNKVLSGDPINIKSGIDEISKDASERFAAVMSRQNPNTAIDVKTFYYKLRGSLKKAGWLGPSGEAIEKVGKNPVREQLLSIYNYLNSTVKGKAAGGYQGFKVNIPEYENLRNAIDSAYSGNKANDYLLPELGSSIRDSAAKTIKGLDKVNVFYRDAAALSELESKGLLSKALDPASLESKLMSIKNVERPNKAQPIRTVIGDELYDDVLAHFANRDFGLVSDIPGAGGGIYTGRSGLRKIAASGATKAYYKDVKPFASRLSRDFGSVVPAAGSYFKKPLSFGNQPKDISKAFAGAGISAGALSIGADDDSVNYGKARNFIKRWEGGKQIKEGKLTSNGGIEALTLSDYNKRNGTAWKMDSLTDEQKEAISTDYFKSQPYEQLPEKSSMSMFNFGWHFGIPTANKYLQRIVGAKMDGIIGPNTLQALESYVQQHGDEGLAQALMTSYVQHMQSRDNYLSNKNGWANRAQNLRKELGFGR